LIPQLEPLTEQQLLAVCNLQQSSEQAEDALSQGMKALQQNLADTLSAGSLGTSNVANYMGQMAMAMGKLGTLENFVRQVENLEIHVLVLSFCCANRETFDELRNVNKVVVCPFVFVGFGLFLNRRTISGIKHFSK
jgi:hypothetical protein